MRTRASQLGLCTSFSGEKKSLPVYLKTISPTTHVTRINVPASCRRQFLQWTQKHHAQFHNPTTEKVVGSLFHLLQVSITFVTLVRLCHTCHTVYDTWDHFMINWCTCFLQKEVICWTLLSLNFDLDKFINMSLPCDSQQQWLD